MKELYYILCLFLFASCNTNKVTKLKIKNNNSFPIVFTVKANNCALTTPSIPPNETIESTFDWTSIDKVDGQWFLFVKNAETGGTDSFAHGYFTKGELSNYLDAESTGGQLKVKVSE